MPHRRNLSAVSFWAMLAAVWALLLLGAAPAVQADALCGSAPGQHQTPGHPTPDHPTPGHHGPDCLACCPCTLSGPLQALASSPPAVPVPRGGELAIRHRAPALVATVLPSPPARARSPPIAA